MATAVSPTECYGSARRHSLVDTGGSLGFTSGLWLLYEPGQQQYIYESCFCTNSCCFHLAAQDRS